MTLTASPLKDTWESASMCKWRANPQYDIHHIHAVQVVIATTAAGRSKRIENGLTLNLSKDPTKQEPFVFFHPPPHYLVSGVLFMPLTHVR